MALWGGRFLDGNSSAFRQLNDSLPFDQVLAEQDIQGSQAWATAIFNAGVLTDSEHQALQGELSALLQRAKAGQLDFSDSDAEDIHSYVEQKLIDKLGDIGRKLHTGRSRNDQVATDLRLWCLAQTPKLTQALIHLIQSLIGSAEHYVHGILPGYTHLQRAQPVRYPHWCLAYVEMFKRDLSRLEDCKTRLAQCPLGCAALAGTTYDIDRATLAEDLGFNSPCLNSLDAISDRDFVLELLFAASTSMMHLSRLAEDLIFYNSGEAGFVQFSDAVTSGSSLMPQKKNPDALELMRGKTGRVYGHLQALLVTLKGLPMAYNKDMQEDKEGLFDAINQWLGCLNIASEVISSLTLHTETSSQAATLGYANATELADYLVGKGIPFRKAHELTGQLVLMAIQQGQPLEALSLEQLQQVSPLIEQDLYQVLTLEALLEKRNQLGGTSKEQVMAALAQARQAFGAP